MRRAFRVLLLSVSFAVAATLVLAAVGFQINGLHIRWDFDRFSHFGEGPPGSTWRWIGWIEEPDGDRSQYDYSQGVEGPFSELPFSQDWRDSVLSERPHHFVGYRLSFRGWPFQWLRVYRGDPSDYLLLPSQLAAQFRLSPGVFVDGVVWLRFLGSVALLAVAIGLPALAVGSTRGWITRSIRRRRGCCEACGYNRAGAVGLRCPECGAESNIVVRASGDI